MFFAFILPISSVIMISDAGINAHIANGKYPVFILFGTLSGPNDPTRVYQAGFEDASDRCHSMAKFIFAHTQMSPGLSRKYNVKPPAFGLFYQQQYIPCPKSLPQTGDAIIEFLGSYLSRFVQKVNSSWVNNDRKRVIYFSKRHTIPSYVSGLVGQFSSLVDLDVGFAQLDDEIQKLFPEAHDQSLFFYNGTIGFENYQGIRNPGNVSEALNKFFGGIGLTRSTDLPKIH